MRANRLGGLLIVAALVAAVPSTQALHPATAKSDLGEDDISGSGCEVPDGKQRCAGATRHKLIAAEIASLWREMAENLRRHARLVPPEKGREFLARAELYEQRAQELEKEA